MDWAHMVSDEYQQATPYKSTLIAPMQQAIPHKSTKAGRVFSKVKFRIALMFSIRIILCIHFDSCTVDVSSDRRHAAR